MNDTSPVTTVAEDEEISLLDLLQTMADNLRLLVLGPLVVGLVTLGYSLTIAPSYTAKTVILPPQQQQSSAASVLASLGNLGSLAGASAGLKNPAEQFLTFLKSPTLQDGVSDRLNLKDRFHTASKTEIRAALAGSVRPSLGKDGLITVEVSAKEPQLAADLANAHVAELRQLLGKLAVTEAQQRRLFFEKQLTQAKDNLATAEVALKATGISSSVLKNNPVSAVAAVAGLKAQVTAQEVKLGAMRGYLADTAPDFKLAMNELANLRGQLAKQEKDEPLANASAGAAGGKDTGDYVTKYREYKYHETLFELFSKQLEIAKVDESREGAVIQVLDVAEPPEVKSHPQKAKMAISATLISGLVLLIFVFLRQTIANAAQNEKSAIKLTQLKRSMRRALGRA